MLLVLAVFVLFLVACGGGGAEPTATSPGASPSPSGTKPSTEQSPAQPPGGTQIKDEAVAFGTEDGITIRGHLYSVPGPTRRVVVFAHEYPKDQRAWQGFAHQLVAPGVAALTFDFRGYGETGGSKDAAKIDLDLDAAVRFLKSRDYPLVYVVGASMGGTAALKVAARQDLAGVVSVSAPTNFMGLDARQDVASVSERKLFIASRGDGDAPAAVTFFMQSAPDPKQSQLFDGSAHGSELLQGASAGAFERLVIDFVSN